MVNTTSPNYQADLKAMAQERLYQVSPRSSLPWYNDPSQIYSDRGPIASIRVISTGNLLGGLSKEARAAGRGNQNNAVSLQDLNDLYADSAKFNRFLLTSINVSYSEKAQIQTTFGDNQVIYFFGKNPVIMNIQGVLIDSLFAPWFTSFINIYDSFLRGTKLAQNFEMIELVLPNMKVAGSILSLSYNQDASRDTDIPFSMQFYAKAIEMLPVTGDPNNPIPTKSVIFSGVPSQTLQVGKGVPTPATTTGGFSEPSWIKSAAGTVSSGYSWFSNNITSPVVKVIGSLTKTVAGLTGTAEGIINQFTQPLNTVLSDITSIAVQATAIANILTSRAQDIGSLLATPGINLKTTLSSLKSTSGIISRLPQDVSSKFKNSFHTGYIPSNAAILFSSRTQSSGASLSASSGNSTSKTAVLSSGTPYSISSSFKI